MLALQNERSCIHKKINDIIHIKGQNRSTKKKNQPGQQLEFQLKNNDKYMILITNLRLIQWLYIVDRSEVH